MQGGDVVTGHEGQHENGSTVSFTHTQMRVKQTPNYHPLHTGGPQEEFSRAGLFTGNRTVQFVSASEEHGNESRNGMTQQ